MEAGSSAKVVDCILELKAFNEWKQMSGGKGFYKPQRSPLVMHSVGKIHSLVAGANSLGAHRQLDMTANNIKQVPAEIEKQKLEGFDGPSAHFDTYIYASSMHLSCKFGSSYSHIIEKIRSNYKAKIC